MDKFSDNIKTFKIIEDTLINLIMLEYLYCPYRLKIKIPQMRVEFIYGILDKKKMNQILKQ